MQDLHKKNPNMLKHLYKCLELLKFFPQIILTTLKLLLYASYLIRNLPFEPFLSIHGSIEGIALGVMNSLKDCSILFTAILLHKWAESFALGISFYKSGTEKNNYIYMIFLFTLFGPLGIIIGMIFSDAGFLIKGIMLGISGGTFIYVAASEIIVEEFSLSKKINIKYLWFLFGGILTFILTFIE